MNIESQPNTVKFTEDLAFAVSNEVRRKNYQIITRNFEVKKFDAIEQENKKDINDLNVELIDGRKVKFEFKNRRENANANLIVLELYNNKNRNIPGWTFFLKRNNIDYVVITWHGKAKECYIILKAKELQEWWEENYSNYMEYDNKPTIHNGCTWISSFAFVPIKDIPKNIIYKHEHFVDLNDFWGKKWN